MNIKTAFGILKSFIIAKIPVMLWGKPGIGKSAIIKKIAAQLGMECIDLRLSQVAADELRGLPSIDKETKTSVWYIPDFLPTSGRGILLLDELDKASTLVKNAALQLILDRKLGNYILPDGWVVIAAGNYEDDGCFSMPIGTALSNRMAHIDIEIDIETWSEWARTADIEPDIISFLNFRANMLWSNESQENAYPSPRTWEMLSRMMKISTDINIVNACVGKTAGAQYAVFSKLYKNVKPEQILKDPERHLKDVETSFRYAAVCSVSEYLKSKDIQKYISNITSMFLVLPPELQVLFLKQLAMKQIRVLAKDEEFMTKSKEIFNSLYNVNAG